jgi:outer membrane protein OmpA-like peptidoglycan-associated protein
MVDMKAIENAIRLFLLVGLFLVGAALIWYIGHYVPSAKKSFKTPVRLVRTQKAVEAPDRQLSIISDPGPFIPKGNGLRVLKTKRGSFLYTEPILFNSGASGMRESSVPKLKRIAEFLARNPAAKLEILGHTDNLGPEPVNLKVSAERAASIKKFLVSQGIDSARIQSKGLGSADPLESNNTQLGRQANRRIEFLIREGEAESSR